MHRRDALDASVWWPIVQRHWMPDNSSVQDDPILAAGEHRGRAVEAKILRLLRGLAVSGLTALEFPLDDRAGALPDISQRIESPEQAEWLARRMRPGQAQRLLQSWADARRRLESASGRPGTAVDLLGRIPSLWLEFDLRRQDEPEPLSCLRLPPESGELSRWIEAAFGPRGGENGWRKTLERCRKALPRQSRALYLFDLSPRQAGCVRLEIFGIPTLEVAEYLGQIGVSAPVHLDRIANCLAACERPHLSFDISPQGEISDRFGLEVSFQRLPSREAGWRRLFERLCAEGLCQNEVAEFFFSWQGQDRPRAAGDQWPTHPTLKRGHFVRVASHVKVVLMGRKPPSAKGYLLFQYLASKKSELSI